MNDSSSLLFLLGFMGGGATIMAFLPLIAQCLATPFGIRKYKITGSAINTITKMACWSSVQDVHGNREGYLFGKWFFSHYEKNVGRDSSDVMYIIAHKSMAHKFISNIGDHDSDDDDDTVITINSDSSSSKKRQKDIIMYIREGGLWRLEYKPLKYTPRVKTPMPHQQTIINMILDEYDAKKSSTVLIHGQPGTGKSMVGELLAQAMLVRDSIKSVSFVDTYNPATPNDTFFNMYNCIEPSKSTPLIIVLEEIDILLEKLHTGDIKVHKDYVAPITNKTTWNQFFDRFDRGLYPHVILIMTTNRPLSWFQELDPSYMRKGRCNLQICADDLHHESALITF